jgi:hypothetical protein
VTHLREFVTGMRKQMSPELFANLLVEVSKPLKECGQFGAAEEMLREALANPDKSEPDARTTFNTRSQLGGVLLAQKKYAEAEPLLVKGYEGMKAREASIPPQAATRIPDALDRLIELFTASGKPNEVNKYRELRAKYPATQDKK